MYMYVYILHILGREREGEERLDDGGDGGDGVRAVYFQRALFLPAAPAAAPCAKPLIDTTAASSSHTTPPPPSLSLSHTSSSSSSQSPRFPLVFQGLLVEVLRKELEPEGVIKYLPATHTVVVQ
jgi:hypothetical protein